MIDFEVGIGIEFNCFFDLDLVVGVFGYDFCIVFVVEGGI